MVAAASRWFIPARALLRARGCSADPWSVAAPRSPLVPDLDGAILFEGAKVEAGARVERSIIGAGARIGPRALIRDAVIGDGADIGARCEFLRGARVWPGVVIPDNGVRFSTDV